MQERTETAPATTLQLHTVDGLNQEMARRHHLEFIGYAWTHAEPYVIGKHTRAICERIDRAIVDYRAGRSTFLVINVPFRHGKSEILSRHLPPHFLGMFPDSHVLLATYSAELAGDHSRDARRIMRSEEYTRMFPGIAVAEDSSAVDRWGIEGHQGGMFAVGIGGSMTGRGYACGLVDDFLKSREEAESSTHDFLTRRAPISITILLNTRWHQDDLVGRISAAMKADPAFPRFEVLTFPAFDEAYPGGTLFPERFPAEWYEQQKAALGVYGTASLLQQQPVARGGNLLKTDKVRFIESDALPPELRFVRFWDPASTVKDKLKADPDFTATVRMAVSWAISQHGIRVPTLYIADARRGRWEAPERDRIIVSTAQMDGPAVRQGVEAVGGYKDTYTRIRDVLQGISVVEAIHPAGDKLVRASPLEPVFEAGNVFLVRAEWNSPYLAELGDFPSGAHDDWVDATSGAWTMVCGGNDWGAL
jgi:predicted phage terminase large subunit-like protein